MDRPGLAQFLRRRREAIRPDDVGLPAGTRRRTPGLRREEVAQLTGMSVDYYNRLEQARAPQPSPHLLRPLARSLRLSDDERDHLFRLAGHPPPERSGRSSHVRGRCCTYWTASTTARRSSATTSTCCSRRTGSPDS